MLFTFIGLEILCSERSLFPLLSVTSFRAPRVPCFKRSSNAIKIIKMYIVLLRMITCHKCVTVDVALYYVLSIIDCSLQEQMPLITNHIKALFLATIDEFFLKHCKSRIQVKHGKVNSFYIEACSQNHYCIFCQRRETISGK